MALSYTDAYGPVLDTGVNTPVTIRPLTEVEVHSATDIDTGSTTAPTSTPAKHVPHRGPGPR